ncbi:MAG: hypothetical protein ABIJ21_07950 [Nanoarchaeota archaeon]
MTNIVFSHALGTFLFDENINLIEKDENNLNQAIRMAKELATGEVPHREAKLKKEGARSPNDKEKLRILEILTTPEHLQQLREINLRITQDRLREDVGDDIIIIQIISLIDDLTKSLNSLTKRAREWHALFLPEASENISDNEGFIKAALKGRDSLIAELHIEESVGAHIKDEDDLTSFLSAIKAVFDEKKKLETYLEKLMHRSCPNVTTLAGAAIGAKLIKEAGSLQKLASMTAGTVQMLGAEKALFRHLKNKKIPPPKHGHIINHPLVMKAKEKGKAARALSDKISLAARIDFFKGTYIGDKLKKDLEEKLK